MNLEDKNLQWQQTIEEFGDRAFERFFSLIKTGSYQINCNENIESAIRFAPVSISLKPLHELFEHDVSFYGDDAYLMWEWQYKNNGTDKWQSCNRPLSFKQTLNYRRKTSAALPFDLERAKNGCHIQVFDGNLTSGWSDAKYEGFYDTDNSIIVGRKSDNYRMRVYLYDLRMKYPPQKKEHS